MYQYEDNATSPQDFLAVWICHYIQLTRAEVACTARIAMVWIWNS